MGQTCTCISSVSVTTSTLDYFTLDMLHAATSPTSGELRAHAQRGNSWLSKTDMVLERAWFLVICVSHFIVLKCLLFMMEA